MKLLSQSMISRKTNEDSGYYIDVMETCCEHMTMDIVNPSKGKLLSSEKENSSEQNVLRYSHEAETLPDIRYNQSESRDDSTTDTPQKFLTQLSDCLDNAQDESVLSIGEDLKHVEDDRSDEREGSLLHNIQEESNDLNLGQLEQKSKEICIETTPLNNEMPATPDVQAIKQSLTQYAKNNDDLNKRVQILREKCARRRRRGNSIVSNALSIAGDMSVASGCSGTVATSMTRVRMTELEQKYFEVMNKNAEFQEQTQDLQLGLAKERERSNKMKTELVTKDNATTLLQEEVSHLCFIMAQKNEATREETSDLTSQIVHKSTLISNMEHDILQMKVEMDNMKLRHHNEIKDLMTQLRNLEENQNETQILRKRNYDLECEVSELNHEIKTLRRKSQRKSNETDNTSETVKVLRYRNEVLKQEIEQLVVRMEQMKTKVTRIEL